MSLLPQLTNPYLDALIIGLGYGLGVCTASCLPYVAGYVAGTGAGFRQGIRITLIFNAGRIVAYAILGAIVGLIGGLLSVVASEAISPLQVYSSLVFGSITIVIGTSVVWKARFPPECGLHTVNASAPGKFGRFGVDAGAFSLGLSRGLIICPPLALLLLYALPFSNPLGSVTLAVLFGLGTTISPLLVLGGITGWLLNKAPLFRRWISLAGGVILIMLGVISLITSLTQLT
jgi:sulfite exporter TauE/SafE